MKKAEAFTNIQVIKISHKKEVEKNIEEIRNGVSKEESQPIIKY